MHDYAKSCICSILRFCHERGQIKRWGAVRHVIVSGIPMRVFLVLKRICHFSKPNQSCSQESVFIRLDVSCVFDVCLSFFEKQKCVVPKVPQKCLGGVWDHPRRILDHVRPILDQNRLQQIL